MSRRPREMNSTYNGNSQHIGDNIGRNKIENYFFGESMYSDRENGSKLALVLLAQSLKEKGFNMIDCQFHTDFLESMGGEYITYEEYRSYIQ